MSATKPFAEPVLRVVGSAKPFKGTYWQCVDHVRDHGGYIVGAGRTKPDPDYQHDLRQNGAIA